MTFKTDFIGIGGAKCGSTWLADKLRSHPNICLPEKKEINYFNKYTYPGLPSLYYQKPISWYARYFRHAKPGQIKGEICPSYLWNENAAQDIYKHNPNMKIIAILRDPADRAFSHYLYSLQIGNIGKISFENALREQPIILETGYYHKHLIHYFNIFPRENILIVFFEDIIQDPKKLLERIQTFLGVPKFIPQDIHEKSRVTGKAIFPWINRSIIITRAFLRKHNLHAIRKVLAAIGITQLLFFIRKKSVKPFKHKPALSQEMRMKLKQIYHEDITALEQLLHKDLSSWK